ncbi:MAG: 23S rRNA (uridine(2552)-2'-O)-methyltransferase RlmE [Gammaproteobacteria bacterium]|nr:23S rRNA (uridine(2552)-2'-O)-methyltransferase RlmE [Gammaproteobacteria bacterium]
MARSKTSNKWLTEHFSDEFVKRAQKEGYRSRAVYKLLEMDDKDKLLKPGMTVVDLGAAPGSWCELLSKRVGDSGRIFALDILPMDALGDVTFIQGDFTEQAVYDSLIEELDGKWVDLVISDMAPNISGMKAVDQPKMMYLAELALEFAVSVLKPGGTFLTKVFTGGGLDEYKKELRQHFAKITVRKPKASRPRSSEIYLLAQQFKKR